MKSFYTKSSKAVFLLPGLLLFTLFVIYPIVPAFVMSLQSHNGVFAEGWVGFKNYATALKSPAFWASHGNTYKILIMELLIGIPLSLLMALILERSGKVAKAIYRFAALFPSVLSVAVIGKMFMGVFNTDWGIINSILRVFGLESLTRSWLSNPDTALICVGTAYVWQYIGFNSILFYTGIRTIPPEFYEAATIDGASFLKASWHITIPLLQDVFKYVLIGATTGTMGLYGLVSVMTAGGPGRSSRTVIFEMSYQAFMSNRFGLGCAIAMLFLVECIVLAILINRFVAREPIKY